ncbi:uncharacterized protein LOC129801729 [Phlebotomus papatasi]|uniref:uncharacterized protein LOC129801729 n=1 Tax=Phlebotomus papatasi TaxID=29031 RepID=UPI002483923D|nr:uncharacterized protein LOC129801729 [Phlebotomus papatasi]
MASGAGFHQSVLDVAFDKFSKKYPSFKRETGRRMIDSLSGAYKSLKSRRQRKESENGSVNILPEEEMKLLEKDQENIPEVKVNKGIKSGVKSEEKVIPKKTEEEYLLKNDDDVQSLRKSEDGDFSKKTEGDLLEKSDDSDDSDFLTADENEDLEIKDSTKDKPSSEDPEKGIPPEKPEDCVVDSVPPGGIGPPHKPKGVDISQYLQKKSMAQGMLDLALLSANTNQLRYILETRDDNVYFYVSITLIISSLVLQVAVGIMLIWSHRFNMRKRSGMASANRINNLSVLGVFLITLINVFISTFGGSSNAGAAVPPASPPASPPVFPVPPSEPPKLPSLDVPVEPGAALA